LEFAEARDLLDRSRRFFQHDLWSTRVSAKLPPTARVLILLARILYIVVTGFRRERIKLRAAALTYVTLLSLIPALAVVFSLFAAFGGLQEVERELREFIVGALTVERHRLALTQYLELFVSNVHAGKIGGFGVAILLFTVVSLLANIEKSFNDIWGLERDRTILQRFQVYWPLITLGPILLGLSLSISTALESSDFIRGVEARAPVIELGARLLPLVLAWVFFTFLYTIMPNTKVPLRYASIGGVVAGTLWVGAQSLYAFYASSAITYSAIYGSLGAIPLFILWIYVSWIVALLGASLTFAAESARTYEPEHEKQKRVPQRDRELVAARLLLAVSRAFQRGTGPVRAQVLIDELLIPPRLARQVLYDLVLARLLVESEAGYVPGRPIDQISVAHVIEVMRSGATDPIAHRGVDPIADAVSRRLVQAEAVLERELGAVTLAELVGEDVAAQETIAKPT
jgi:membrane protein